MRTSFFSFGLLATSLASVTLANSKPSPTKDYSETVIFPITLTWGKGAPDGFERDLIYVNGQFPGKTLDVKQGVNVEFVVYNQLPFATTIHFHGIEQFHTPWSDGVPGLTQSGIQPGETFVYKWKAEQYGTYWYHSHYKGQLEDGLFGAIRIKPAEGTPNPLGKISNTTQSLYHLQKAIENPELVLLSDWSHFTSEQLYNTSIEAKVDPICGDSLLVNGKGSVNCPGVSFLMSLNPPQVLPFLQGQNLTDKGCIALSNTISQTTRPKNLDRVPLGMWEGCNATTSELTVIEADPQKGWISLNFISTASMQVLAVSIDDHPMWVYEIDGHHVEPQLVDAMTLSHGGRHAVMVQLDKPARDYTIHLASSGFNQKVYTSATLSYKGGNGENIPNASINYAGLNTTSNVRTFDEKTIVPFPPIHPAQNSDQTFKLVLNHTGEAYSWSFKDEKLYLPSHEDITPLIYNSSGLDGTGLTITTKNNTWIDLIFVTTISGGIQPSHPIHKHSNKGFVIGYGSGEFNYTDVAEALQFIPQNFNLDSPPYRDTFTTLPALAASTWMVVRYKSENPGPFLMHCHISPHLTGGMGVAILDGYGDWPAVPPEYQPGANGGTISGY